MLTVSHISKTFNPGTVNEKCAIRDLSLHLDPGDFVTIFGANGAGKSMLFNAIAGSFYTDSGSIFLAGRDITFLPEYRRAKIIGRLFQDPMLGSAPGMTIEENLALAAGTVLVSAATGYQGRRATVYRRRLDGRSKLVEQLSYPPTARRCVQSVITDLAWIDVSAHGFLLRELARKDDVPVENGARLVGYRLGHVIAFDKNGVKRRYGTL